MSIISKYRESLTGNAATAFDFSYGQTQMELATKMKEGRDGLALVVGPEASLTDAQISRMAGEYLKDGTITVHDENDQPLETYTRDELLTAAKDKLGESKGILEAFPETSKRLSLDNAASINLEEELLHQNAMALPAKRISEAVQENDGWMSKIMFAIQGFFKWLMSGFQNGGLMNSIHEVAADSIADSARGKIAQDIKNHPEIGVALGGKEGLDRIRNQVYENTLATANGGKPIELNDALIAERLGQVEAKALGPSIAELTDQDVGVMENELKGKIANMAQENINDYLEYNDDNNNGVTNQNFFDDMAADIRAEAQRKAEQAKVKESKKEGNDTFLGGLQNMIGDVASGDAIRRNMTGQALQQIISGAVKDGDGKGVKELDADGKPRTGTDFISAAISEGALDAVKNMSKEELKEFIADPEGKADEFSQKVAEATFNTEEWKKVETNIDASTILGDDEKAEMITKMKTAVQGQLNDMVTDMSGQIKEAQPMQGMLDQMVNRVRERDNTRLALGELDKNKDKTLSLEELGKTYDINNDQKISKDELPAMLAAMSDEQKIAFDQLLANDTSGRVERAQDGSVSEINFGNLATNVPTQPVQPGKDAGLAIT